MKHLRQIAMVALVIAIVVGSYMTYQHYRTQDNVEIQHTRKCGPTLDQIYNCQ